MAQRICTRCGGADCECYAPAYKEDFRWMECNSCGYKYTVDTLGAMRHIGCPYCKEDES